MHNEMLQIRPGRVAALFLPTFEPSQTAAVEAAILQSIDAARQAGVKLIQSLLPPDAREAAALLKRCQFDDLGEAFYLVCPRDQLAVAHQDQIFTWQSLDQVSDADERLVRLLTATYERSADCAAMNDPRATEEIIEGHRGVGAYDPARWMLAQLSGVDVGCLLLSEHRPFSEWEIVYMGIVPEHRGRGLGRSLVGHAQWLARQGGAASLGAAVDAANLPALAAYRACGFDLRHRHRLLVRSLV